VKALDVVVVVNLKVGESKDRRPCVLVEFRGDSAVLLAPCSSQFDMYDPALHFKFSDWQADFAATGFLRSSYAVDDFVERPRDDVVKVIGHLEGEYADTFLDWAGLDPPSGG